MSEANEKETQSAQNPPAAMTPEQVQSIVDAAVTKATAPLHQTIQQMQGEAKTGDVRSRFIGEKMKDVPELYRQQIPKTSDLHVLAAEEQKIRTQWRADLAAAGVEMSKPVGGQGGGLSPLAKGIPTSDTRTPTELIAEGLRKKGDTRG